MPQGPQPPDRPDPVNHVQGSGSVCYQFHLKGLEIRDSRGRERLSPSKSRRRGSAGCCCGGAVGVGGPVLHHPGLSAAGSRLSVLSQWAASAQHGAYADSAHSAHLPCAHPQLLLHSPNGLPCWLKASEICLQRRRPRILARVGRSHRRRE